MLLTSIRLAAVFPTTLRTTFNTGNTTVSGSLDSPETIRSVAHESPVDLEACKLFYYEVFEKQFDDEGWQSFAPVPSIPTNVVLPVSKNLEGFDVARFSCGSSPECSPLSCNSLAGELDTNPHCLFPSLEQAEESVVNGKFDDSEPGPYRIFAVYSVEWR